MNVVLPCTVMYFYMSSAQQLHLAFEQTISMTDQRSVQEGSTHVKGGLERMLVQNLASDFISVVFFFLSQQNA